METNFKKMTNTELAEYICDILYVEVMNMGCDLSFSREINDDKGGVLFIDCEIAEFDREPGEYFGIRSLAVAVYDEDDNEINVDYNFENYVDKLLDEYFN